MGELRNVPGVGAKTEQTLFALGYDSLAALRDADPDELYIKACLLENKQMDKYALYVFRCAVAYAKDPAPDQTNTVGGSSPTIERICNQLMKPLKRLYMSRKYMLPLLI